MTTAVTIVIKMVNIGKTMQIIKASEFKAKCLSLMDMAATTDEPWRVTKNSRPVADLRPYSNDHIDSPFSLHPTSASHGDVVAPLD